MSVYLETPKMPSWLRKQLPEVEIIKELSGYLKSNAIETVCANSRCPNIGECYSAGNVSFLILGNICTRNCRFCAIQAGKPARLNPEEPRAIANAVLKLQLRYVVITSVTRDDVPDGGAQHYARVVRAIKEASPLTTVETLVPDFNGSKESIDKIVEAGVDVLSHNMETVQRLYSQIRPDFDYLRSLEVLRYVSSLKRVAVKSGFMVGMDETQEEIEWLLADIKNAGCSILTIGQYLRPREARVEVKRYVPPEEFDALRKAALGMGFDRVASAPFVRSSYMAEKLLRYLEYPFHGQRSIKDRIW